MEENFLGKPSGEIIRSVILGWYNEQIDREILSGLGIVRIAEMRGCVS